MDDDPVQTLMAITEKTVPQCRAALQMAQGDLERAMSLLLDGVVDAMGDAADFATSFQPEPAAPAPARAALSPPACVQTFAYMPCIFPNPKLPNNCKTLIYTALKNTKHTFVTVKPTRQYVILYKYCMVRH